MLTTLYRIIKYGFQGFRRNGWQSVPTLSVITLTLFVFLSLILFNVFTREALGVLRDKIDINVYFQNGVAEDDIFKIQRALESLSEVKSAEYVSKAKALEEFQETLSEKFRRIDIPQPEKYSAHITLGRMQRTDPVTTKAFLDKLDDIEAPVFSPFTPEEVICYKSLVSKTGSTYQVYTRFPY